MEAKIAPDLVKSLVDAGEHSVLHVILTLRMRSRFRKEEKTLHPKDFENHAEYRKAAIAAQRYRISEAVGSTLERLKQMNLKVKGGQTSSVVVAEGAAHDVIKAIELDAIEHADVDREIGIIP